MLNLHHLPHTLTAVVGDGSDLGARVRYSWEQPVVLGSAGGPRHALPIIGADTFFIVNGDTLTDLDLRALAAAHEASGALVTLALVPNREPHKYGGVLTGADGRVTGFAPRGAGAEGSYHFIGVQVAQADAFRALPDGQAVIDWTACTTGLLESQAGLHPGVCLRRGISGHRHAGRLLDHVVRVPWRPTARTGVRRSAFASTPARASTRSILWDDVEVGAGAVVEECIVTDRVQIPAGVGAPPVGHHAAAIRRAFS